MSDARRWRRPKDVAKGSRLLRCHGACGELVTVWESAHGAKTDQEHQFLDADTYVCGDCLVTSEEQKSRMLTVGVSPGAASALSYLVGGAL